MRNVTTKNLDLALAAYDENSYIDHEEWAVSPDNNLVAPSPEEIFLQKEDEEIKETLYKSLSDEAKQLVSIILNGPPEIANVFLPRQGLNFSKASIYKALKKQWGDAQSAKDLIAELCQFVKSF